MMHDGGKATIHIVARDPDVRRGLIRLVEGAGWHTVAAERFPEDFESCVATRPGCLVLDASRFAANRFELQQLMRSPTMFPVIAISQPVDLSIAVEAMKDGVFHFMERPFRDRELLDRIHAAVRRDTDHRQALAHHADLKRRAASLTPRERQVMALVADGKASKVIAVNLGLSDRTVGIDRAKVMDKMRAVSIAHLVRMHLALVRTARRQGLFARLPTVDDHTGERSWSIAPHLRPFPSQGDIA